MTRTIILLLQLGFYSGFAETWLELLDNTERERATRLAADGIYSTFSYFSCLLNNLSIFTKLAFS